MPELSAAVRGLRRPASADVRLSIMTMRIDSLCACVLLSCGLTSPSPRRSSACPSRTPPSSKCRPISCVSLKTACAALPAFEAAADLIEPSTRARRPLTLSNSSSLPRRRRSVGTTLCASYAAGRRCLLFGRPAARRTGRPNSCLRSDFICAIVLQGPRPYLRPCRSGRCRYYPVNSRSMRRTRRPGPC